MTTAAVSPVQVSEYVNLVSADLQNAIDNKSGLELLSGTISGNLSNNTKAVTPQQVSQFVTSTTENQLSLEIVEEIPEIPNNKTLYVDKNGNTLVQIDDNLQNLTLEVVDEFNDYSATSGTIPTTYAVTKFLLDKQQEIIENILNTEW